MSRTKVRSDRIRIDRDSVVYLLLDLRLSLVLVPREMPLSRIHLDNLKKAADYGCILLPPMLTFYNHPTTVKEQVDHIVGKVLMQFGMKHKAFIPWEGK